MGNYEFTYEFPNEFQQKLIHSLELNDNKELAGILRNCKIEHTDMGYAHYAGMHGDTWNKIALDFTLEASIKNIEALKRNNGTLEEWIQRTLKPNETGFLIRNLDYIVCDEEIEMSLPEKTDDDLQTLSRDIAEALSRSEPTLVLDRLHTFSVKFIREICRRHSIKIMSDQGDLYPLQSLAGALVKYYRQNNLFQSEFTERALKVSISLFEGYNSIRNDKSYAHDNKVLNNTEATYTVKIMSATLNLIDAIENVKMHCS